jgi:hypothetical protein
MPHIVTFFKEEKMAKNDKNTELSETIEKELTSLEFKKSFSLFLSENKDRCKTEIEEKFRKLLNAFKPYDLDQYGCWDKANNTVISKYLNTFTKNNCVEQVRKDKPTLLFTLLEKDDVLFYKIIENWINNEDISKFLKHEVL